MTSDTTRKSLFQSGKCIVPRANHYARLRKRLQKKGTRSATRKLVAISGRERRLKADANHCVSKRIVTQRPNSLVGLESLTDIRERTRRKRGKKASKKQRKANAAYSNLGQGGSDVYCKGQLNRSYSSSMDASVALAQHGFAVLAFDLRGIGESALARLSLGYYEQRDVLGAVDFLRSGTLPYANLGRPRSIEGCGDSLGGATLLLAAAQEPAIQAVVTDSAFADASPLIREKSGIPAILLPGCLLAAKLLSREKTRQNRSNTPSLSSTLPLYFFQTDVILSIQEKDHHGKKNAHGAGRSLCAHALLDAGCWCAKPGYVQPIGADQT